MPSGKMGSRRMPLARTMQDDRPCCRTAVRHTACRSCCTVLPCRQCQGCADLLCIKHDCMAADVYHDKSAAVLHVYVHGVSKGEACSRRLGSGRLRS